MLPEKRKLTEDEIEYVASVIPSERFPTKEDYERARELRRRVSPYGVDVNSEEITFAEAWSAAFSLTNSAYLDDIREHVRVQLRQIEIIPILLEKLRETIRINHDRSHISPGAPVGIVTAMSAGAQVQQATLNSFHSSGSSSNVQSGVEQIRMLINLSRSNPNPTCTIHFKRQITYLDALRKEADLVGVTVLSLCEDASFSLMTVDTFERPWWYALWEQVEGPLPPHSAHFLRVKLDTIKMYQYGVNIEDVVNAINVINHLDILRCVYSPLHIGIVDIYATRNGVQRLVSLPPTPTRAREVADDEEDDENAPPTAEDMRDIIAPLARPSDISGGDGDDGCECSGPDPHEDAMNNAALTLLTTSVATHLRTHAIKGVPNIIALTPVMTPVISLVDTEKSLGDGRWRLNLNGYRERVNGIQREYLEKLLTLCGIEVLERGDTYFVVRNPERGNPDAWVGAYIEAYTEGDVDPDLDVELQDGDNWTAPSATVNARLRFDKWKYQRALDKLERENAEVIEIPREKFKRLDAGDYITIVTTGSNLRALLQRPEIDTYRTTSNNVYEIASMFGIGAARSYLLTAFRNLFAATGSYVPPRHIALLVDFQTSRGMPLSVTYSGLAKRNTHTLALATNQRSMTVFKNAAAIGKREAVRGPSAQIMTNRRGNYGTGHFTLLTKTEELERRAKEIEEERARAEEEKRAARAGVIDPDEIVRELGYSPSRLRRAAGGEDLVEEEQYDGDLIFSGAEAPTASTLVDELLTDKRTPASRPARAASPEEAGRLLSEAGIMPTPEPAHIVDPKLIDIATRVRVTPIAVGAQVENVSTAPDKLVPGDPLEAADIEKTPPTRSAGLTRRRPRIALPDLGDSAPENTEGADIASFLSSKKVDINTAQQMASGANITKPS